MRRALYAIVTFLGAGCGGDPASGSASAAPSSSAAPAASVAPAPDRTGAPPEAPAPPEDLDRAALVKALKCHHGAKNGLCGVLEKFGACTPWAPVVPSGDGRWVGHGTVVEGKKRREVVAALRSRRVPTSEVGPGQVPAKIGIAELTKEDGNVFDHADRAIRALENADVTRGFNATIDHVKNRKDWTEGYAVTTAGGQVYVLRKAGAFICQGPKRQLLLIERAATRGASADGLYAELWAVSW